MQGKDVRCAFSTTLLSNGNFAFSTSSCMMSPACIFFSIQLIPCLWRAPSATPTLLYSSRVCQEAAATALEASSSSSCSRQMGTWEARERRRRKAGDVFCCWFCLSVGPPPFPPSLPSSSLPPASLRNPHYPASFFVFFFHSDDVGKDQEEKKPFSLLV